MKTIKFFASSLLFACAALLFALPALAAPDPVEQVKPVVNKITAMLTTEEYRGLPREQQFDRFLAVAQERFDFDEMSKRVLGPQWGKLTAEQKALFHERFSRLLGYTYMDKIDTYNGEPIDYLEPRIKNDRAEVRTSIKFADGNTAAISYIMQLKGEGWMAYDLVVENISLVRNYMEQLRSILQKNGFDGLIKQIDDKIEQMKTAKVGKK